MLKSKLLFMCICTVLFLPWVANQKTDFVIMGAGDIADCNETAHERTAELLSSTADVIFTLGDNAYMEGTSQQYQDCFHPTWGQFYDQIKSVVGNHEYRTTNAQGYKTYFNTDDTYYSYSLGNWLIIVLDSNCKRIGGCGTETKQFTWLDKTLNENESPCIIAMWHHPLYSSNGTNKDSYEFFKLLYKYRADVVLTGHHHYFERFNKIDHNNNRQADGIRQFIVGTGGKKLNRQSQNAKNSVFFDRKHYGIIQLALTENEYSWEFITIDEGVKDRGSDNCN